MSDYVILRYLFIAITLCIFSRHAQAANNHEIKIAIDYFNKDLDLVNYLEKIQTSSIPEELKRVSAGYQYQYKNMKFGAAMTRENGHITRVVEPLEIKNIFNDYQLNFSILSLDKSQEVLIDVGSLKQSEVTLDCVQRSNILLGGNCEEADFKLLDGGLFEETGERKYLPVLSSSAQSHYFQIAHMFHQYFSELKLSFNTSVAVHKVSHDSYSPLFALTSDFLLNSVIKDKTLRLIIDELKEELPQSSPWYDVVFGVNFDMFYKALGGQIMTSAGVLYSEKVDFDAEQTYKHNVFIKMGYTSQVTDNLNVEFSGTAYQHYLQGVQPVLYTPKTAKFFAHPYAEIRVSVGYRF